VTEDQRRRETYNGTIVKEVEGGNLRIGRDVVDVEIFNGETVGSEIASGVVGEVTGVVLGIELDDLVVDVLSSTGESDVVTADKDRTGELHGVEVLNAALDNVGGDRSGDGLEGR
jgi:hypothetical protein